MFDTLPQSFSVAQSWRWSEYQPYAADLLARALTPASLDTWLGDWTRLAALLEEVNARLYVATTIDTADAEAEGRFLRFQEQVVPESAQLSDQLNRKLLDSGLIPANFQPPLRKIRAEVALFRQENLPLRTEETRLSTVYNQIIGSQTVVWDGEEKTLSQMDPVFQERDRPLRERAWHLVHQRRLQDRGRLNDLWGDFLRIRRQVADNAGFASYRDYQWQALGRFDYSPADAEHFQAAIERVVVPAAERVYARRRQRLGLSSLRPWDLEVDLTGRDPLRPFETVAELEDGAERIFWQVDPKLGQYVRQMRSEGLLDLDNRKGKAPGGYCIGFPVAQRPFIFMNAVGLHDDVQTLLHESGHAFHCFEAGKLPYKQQFGEIPMEFAEVASMAMELLASPYLSRERGGFYSEADAARARISHLESAITFWPYMAVVDAFQHWAYTQADAAQDPAQCDAYWAQLWGRFMRGIDHSGLEDWVATGWQRKLHIFQMPFYYIEYGLAQLGAVQIWANSLQDPAQALAAYLRALALGNTVPLPQLYAAAGARFAFDSDILTEAIDLLEHTIAELDPDR